MVQRKIGVISIFLVSLSKWSLFPPSYRTYHPPFSPSSTSLFSTSTPFFFLFTSCCYLCMISQYHFYPYWVNYPVIYQPYSNTNIKTQLPPAVVYTLKNRGVLCCLNIIKIGAFSFFWGVVFAKAGSELSSYIINSLLKKNK